MGAGLLFVGAFVAIFYGLTVLLRRIYSVSEDYSSQYMAVGCLVTPLLSLAGFMILNWLCQTIDSLLRQPDYLVYEFVFSLVAVAMIWWLRSSRPYS